MTDREREREREKEREREGGREREGEREREGGREREEKEIYIYTGCPRKKLVLRIFRKD